MKSLFIFFAMLVMAVQAQAQYTGGEGDGYASAGTSFRVGEAPVVEADVQLGLSEEEGQWTVVLFFEGVETKVDVEAFDLHGRKLTEWQTQATGAWEERHALQNWATSVYIFRIKIDGTKEFTEKILNPYTIRE